MIDDNLSEEKLFNNIISYPNPTDPDIQYKLYLKKELYNYKIAHRPEFNNYNDLKQYRDLKCSGKITLSNHQVLLGNYLTPDMKQKGVILMHGLGSGKTCVAVNIAEHFKSQIEQYKTKIYVLVPGPVLKKNWVRDIIKCTGSTYGDPNDPKTINNVHEYYRIMSYKGFARRVLGEKIKELESDNKTKKQKYKKDKEGNVERLILYDQIHNLDNTLLIVDEAHSILNDYGEAVKKMIQESKNLKVLLLTGTPMNNEARDIIRLLNIIVDEPIKESDVFTGEYVHNINFTPNGKEILKKYLRGYISYLKGGDEYLFAKKVEHGIVPKHLKFTKVTMCKMLDFQQEAYNITKEEYSNDTLERASSDVVNFIYPLLKMNISESTNKLNKNKVSRGGADISDENIYKGITFAYGREGISQVKTFLKHNQDLYQKELTKFISKKLLIPSTDINDEQIIYLNNNEITGDFLKKKYLKLFSIKFFTALKNLNQLFEGKKGCKNAFIYSNLVLSGINIFKQILLQNGYLEYIDESSKEQFNDNTKCYYCGIKYKNHNTKYKQKKIKEHEYSPACFISITGQDDENNNQENSDINITKVFNNPNNYDGKYAKFVLGSRVLCEGTNLFNVFEVHVLDVWFNFSRTNQVIGRALRTCSHYHTMTELNPYPIVDVYKYCIESQTGEMTTEELLYQNAEKKHILIKQVERMIKEEAFDCGLFYNGNKILNEIKEPYKDCIPLLTGTDYDNQKIKKNEVYCPVECDYMQCDFKCANPKLDILYDKNKNEYKDINFNNLDTSTYDIAIFMNEVNFCKIKIKELYLIKYVYELFEIVNYIKDFYIGRENQYDVYFIYKALDLLIPTDTNELNNLQDFIFDKYNRQGYLIYVNGYYIYQYINDPLNVPMYYRSLYKIDISNDIKLFEYMKYNKMLESFKEEEIKLSYDFDSVMSYYLSREEFDYVGIIDKEPNKKKNKNIDELNDSFRFRQKIKITSDKKRLTGLQTFKGSVCFNSYTMDYLKKAFKKLGIEFDPSLSRMKLCNQIKEKLLELEKYSTNNMTYVIIPADHPIYPFPYNLKDRCKYISNQITSRIKNININIEKKTKSYKISIINNDSVNKNQEFMKELGFTLEQNTWIKIIE